MGVQAIKVGEELLGVFCIADNAGIIHVPNPDPVGLGQVLRVLTVKSSMNRLATEGLRGEPIAAPCTPS